jgi:chorismate mutase/prephenate dehydratase
VEPSAGRRTTIVVAVRNEPGTLLAVLRVIAAHGLNMRKLESRPSRERAWEYVFWIDLDGDLADPAMAAALDEVRGVTTMTRILGSYPSPDA